MRTESAQLDARFGPAARPIQSAKVSVKELALRTTGDLVERLRVMLAVIAGLLMLDAHPDVQLPMTVAILAFSAYAIALLLMAASGSTAVRHHIFYWLDACWFLLLLSLAGSERTHYFLFLFFPVVFSTWRTGNGYREGTAIAAFSGLASLVLFAVRDPDMSWTRLLTLPMSLFIIGPIFVALARDEAATRKGQVLAASIVEGFDPRQGLNSIMPDLLARIARNLGASAAILPLQTFEGRVRVYCWEAEDGSSELSEAAAFPVAEQALSLSAEAALGWSGTNRWWRRDRHIGVGPSGSPLAPSLPDRETLQALATLLGKKRLISVPLSSGIGRLRLILAGDSIEVTTPSLDMLVHVVDQITPSVENAYLRERLATEAAETERARIGRDLHDSAIQPYIGLKFALEAVQRRAESDNPVAADLNHLVRMATDELASMREVISGLRGTPGKGGALLSSAVRRQASRFAQLFGIQVEVEVAGDMPVSRRIAGEMFHIVAEGLSNIRRHTRARRAWISLSTTSGMLVLGIRNENDEQTPAKIDFTPSSLTERAIALGGSLELDRDDSSTTVTVRVPIPTSKSSTQ